MTTLIITSHGSRGCGLAHGSVGSKACTEHPLGAGRTALVAMPLFGGSARCSFAWRGGTDAGDWACKLL